MAASTSKHSGTQESKDIRNRNSNKGKGKERSSKVSSIPVEQWAEENAENDIPWKWTYITDPSSSRTPPVFTSDGKFFFSLVGSMVKIYSTNSGLVVSTLQSPSPVHRTTDLDILTSAVINPQNSFQLIVGSLDGRIFVWDFVDATLLQTINLGQPIHFICAHKQFNGSVFVAASLSGGTDNDNNAVILQISLKAPDRSSQSAVIIKSIGKTRFPTGLSISPNGAWLVATAGHKAYVARTSSLSSGFTKYVSPERLTCLSFHPFEEYFCTGDDKGVIRLWYCLNNNLAVHVKGVEKRTQTRSLHWHAHAVSSVSFTPNGAYLLTGGEESVLVIWQLQTGKKEFVPRLGAQISTISVARKDNREEEYLIGLADSTYVFVNPTNLKVTRSYSRIKIDASTSQDRHFSSKSNRIPLAIHPLTGTLVLPSSHPSSLQMYSPRSSSVICELEVSPSNRVSRRDDKPIMPACVVRVVISECGDWMATIDSREGVPGFHSEIFLKIWRWDEKQENWVLNTRIDRPHGMDSITDIHFSPGTLKSRSIYLVTTGKDCNIKLFKLSSDKDIWTCRGTFKLHSKTPSSISWSPDISLFAVSIGIHVAVYDPLTCSLRQTLTTPECQTIHSVHFIGVSGQHILAVGESSLVMWDLVESRVAWQAASRLPINRVISVPKESSFIIFHSRDSGKDRNSKVSLYYADSSIPYSTRSIPFGILNVIWASFKDFQGFNFVGVTHSWRLVFFGENYGSQGGENTLARGLTAESHVLSRTLFQDIFGASAFSATASALPITSMRRLENDQNFADAAFAALPLNLSFDPLINLFLKERPPDFDETKGSSGDDFISMEPESDTPIVVANRPSRILSHDERDIFIKLFQSQCMVEKNCLQPDVEAILKVTQSPTLELNGHKDDFLPLKVQSEKSSLKLVGTCQSRIDQASPPLDSPSLSTPRSKKRKTISS